MKHRIQPALSLQAFDDLFQAPGLVLVLLAQAVQFRCHFGLHLLHAVAHVQDRLHSGQVHAQVWPQPPVGHSTTPAGT